MTRTPKTESGEPVPSSTVAAKLGANPAVKAQGTPADAKAAETRGNGSNSSAEDREAGVDFIREIVREHNRTGRFGGKVHTRFPPEPNGYLHVGHAKSICLNYGIAADFGGKFNLRMDDTNPEKEEQEYVDSIIEDVRWLGAKWTGMREDDSRAGVIWSSNYFDQMYAWGVELIKKGKAYVCDLTAEEIRDHRGTLTRPGKESPYRNRTVAENLDLFERMRAGEFPDGSRTLRAKIDMNSPNLNLRDPVMYRIVHAPHHNTGDKWCIYPMYDWAHGFEDSLEGITHSICTLEFENHRPLYDWFISAVNDGRTEDGSGPWGKKIHHPQQIEFARLNLTYTLMSKRRLLELVKNKIVSGWNDPRMPTISGMRRRGYTPEALRDFCARIGVAKVEGTVELALLEHCVREDLNRRARRVMGVLDPIKLVVENYPEDLVEEMDAVNNPEDASMGTRKVPFCRELWIEQEDFREEPPKKYYRLAPGQEVRLRYAYLVRCTGVVKDPKTGAITEVRCTYDPETRGGNTPDGRKVKGTIHWVSARHAVPAEVRLYDVLFGKEDPGDVPEGGNFLDNLNPKSLEVVTGYLEPCLGSANAGDRFQFERLGYFCADIDSEPGRPVFNRTVTLKDSWAKIEQKQGR